MLRFGKERFKLRIKGLNTLKQVWILNHYASDPGSAGSTRHYDLSEKLLSHGWQATIIAGSVELNSGKQRLNKKECFCLEMHGKVPFLWVRTSIYIGNGVGRMMNMLFYTYRTLLPRYTRQLPPPDLVVGSSVHPFAALAGALLAKKHNVPFVFEVRDLWPQTLVDIGRFKAGSVSVRLLRVLEKWLYRKATRIVTLLPKAVDYIVPLGISKKKIVWIPNGVSMATRSVTEDRSKKYKGQDAFVLMYFGAHGLANGLDNVIRAMKVLEEKQLAESRIILRLIGNGPLKPALKQMMNDLGLKNVFFEDAIKKEEIPVLAAEADAFIFNLIEVPVFKFGISSNKLFDYMAAAKPVLFCCDSANNPIEEAGAGITIPPGDPGGLAQKIVELYGMSNEERRIMGEAGRSYVCDNHEISKLSKRLGMTFDDAVASYSTRKDNV